VAEDSQAEQEEGEVEDVVDFAAEEERITAHTIDTSMATLIFAILFSYTISLRTYFIT